MPVMITRGHSREIKKTNNPFFVTTNAAGTGMDIENDRFIDYRAPRAPLPQGRLTATRRPPPGADKDWSFMYVPASSAIGGQIPISDSKVAAALEVARAADLANKTRLTSHTFALDEAATSAAAGGEGGGGEGGEGGAAGGGAGGGGAEDSVDGAMAEWMAMRSVAVQPRRQNPMYETTANLIGGFKGEEAKAMMGMRSVWQPKSNDFSKKFGGEMSRYQGLQCSMPNSKVASFFDGGFGN